VLALSVPQTVQDDEEFLYSDRNPFFRGWHMRSVNRGILNSICETWSGRDHPQRRSRHNHKGSVMNAKSPFMMGFMVMIAMAVLFVALNDLAADAQTTSNSEGVTAKSMADDVKIPETPAPQWWVVDAKGNVYLPPR
jgi:hypothetical protein